MAGQLSCPPPFPHILNINSKDSITMEVMICTVPMPHSVLMAILSQLAHVACGICDSNTVKNDETSATHYRFTRGGMVHAWVGQKL